MKNRRPLYSVEHEIWMLGLNFGKDIFKKFAKLQKDSEVKKNAV